MAKNEDIKAPASCGCGTANATPCCSGDAGSGRHAVGVDPELKEQNLRHLARIEGQVRGLIKMVNDDRYCADIITQVTAVRESLHSVAKNLMRNHIKHCAAAAIRRGDGDAEAMYDEIVDLVGRISR
jgi:DNA-binding FrmR family transcriptional regulator